MSEFFYNYDNNIEVLVEEWLEPYFGRNYLVVGSCADYVNTQLDKDASRTTFDYEGRDIDVFIPESLKEGIEKAKNIGGGGVKLDVLPLPDKVFDWVYQAACPKYQVPKNYMMAIIRMAHLHRDWNWFKNARTLRDKYKSNPISDLADMRVFDDLYSFWTDYEQDKRINLCKPNEDFFDDNVKRLYEHDSIHLAIAKSDGLEDEPRPMYEKLKDVIGNAWTGDIDKLNKHHLHTLMMEEIWTVAIERFILTGIQPQPSIAKVYAYKQLCTTMTKGKFRKALVLNFFEIINDKEDYYGRFLRNKHKLIPINK